MTLVIKKNNIFFLFLLLPFIAMIIPAVIGYGNGNIFVMDFLAKRLMTLFVLPIIGLLLIYLIYQFVFNINKVSKLVSLYLLCWILYLISSIYRGNQLNYLLVDAFVSILPLIFYIAVFNFNFNLSHNQYLILLCLGYVLTLFNIKLQFSYFNLIAIVYVVFITKINIKNLAVFIALPFVIKNALLGKSALIMLLFLLVTLYFKKFNFISFNRKKSVTYLLILSFTVGSIFLGEYISQTGSYRHFTYFIKNANFSSLEFKDASTGNRLFEAQKVMESFKKNSFSFKLIGAGFGSTIDLSETVDATVINANSNSKKIHNIHMGFFAVLYRYGILGLIIYILYIYVILKKSIFILNKSNSIIPILSSLYLLIIVFDSLISFPHMMSNFMFWFSSAIVLFNYKKIKQNRLLHNLRY